MLLNKQKLIMLQNLLLIHGVTPGLQYAANKRIQSKINLSLFYILNLIGNEKMWLTSIFGASNEKKRNSVADQVKSYGLKK